MEFIISKNIGFCNGVKNATNKTLLHLKGKNSRLYCLGNLVHNRLVINELVNRGLVTIDNIKNISNCKLIISTHGTTKDTYNSIKDKNIDLVDLTCPKVLAIHKLVENLSNKKFFIILVGNKKHEEMIGTSSFCNNSYIIIESITELNNKINLIAKFKDIAVISQTTYSLEKFENICEFLKRNLFSSNLKIFNTICHVTKNRQMETIDIAKKVNIMIIIGDKKSSNSKKLYEISKKIRKNTIFVQRVNDLNYYIKTIKKANKVGIVSSASAPIELVNDVHNYLKKF